jgi:hypothetical protein
MRWSDRADAQAVGRGQGALHRLVPADHVHQFEVGVGRADPARLADESSFRAVTGNDRNPSINFHRQPSSRRRHASPVSRERRACAPGSRGQHREESVVPSPGKPARPAFSAIKELALTRSFVPNGTCPGYRSLLAEWPGGWRSRGGGGRYPRRCCQRGSRWPARHGGDQDDGFGIAGRCRGGQSRIFADDVVTELLCARSCWAVPL